MMREAQNIVKLYSKYRKKSQAIERQVKAIGIYLQGSGGKNVRAKEDQIKRVTNDKDGVVEGGDCVCKIYTIRIILEKKKKVQEQNKTFDSVSMNLEKEQDRGDISGLSSVLRVYKYMRSVGELCNVQYTCM